MKSRTLVIAVLLALVFGSIGVSNSPAGEISPGSLAKMGFAGVQRMSDREGKQVRGTGSAAGAGGFSFAANNHAFSFGTVVIAAHSTTTSSASASSTSFVFVH